MKIQALKHMKFPPDKETMRSFLGMVNYLNRYSALSAHLAAPLSSLTHQVVDYKPAKVHFENFNRLKMEISNMRALPYFDVNAETTSLKDPKVTPYAWHLIEACQQSHPCVALCQ